MCGFINKSSNYECGSNVDHVSIYLFVPEFCLNQTKEVFKVAVLCTVHLAVGNV